jgi:hypothetical protein
VRARVMGINFDVMTGRQPKSADTGRFAIGDRNW